MLTDDDLLSIQEARDQVRTASRAYKQLHGFDQQRIDRICEAIARAAQREAPRLARMAVEETGFGDVHAKTRKALFASVEFWESVRDLKTVGMIRRDDEKRVYEFAEPFGVIVGIVPVTNPPSTALFKMIAALKTRNAIVLSPHPRAVRCISESVKIAAEAAKRAGAPHGVVQCLQKPTLEGTRAAMTARETALILATGGPGLVRAAYSCGKPAIGVGPGNAPCYIEKTADVERAVEAVVQSQVFDNSVICSSEQAVVVDRAIKEQVVEGFLRRRAYLCNADEQAKIAKIVVRGRAINPAIVGLYPYQLAEMAGFSVPQDTTVILAEAEGVGWEHPLSIEKLAPILALYTVEDWREGCKRCIELLNFGGRGHTMSMHTENEKVVWEFAAQKPTNRLLVNSPSAQGAVGYSTNLRPSMTLGCGSFGGNITSDNISAEHLMQIKRVAWGKPGFIDEEAQRREASGPGVGSGGRAVPMGSRPTYRGSSPAFRSWPKPPRHRP